MKFLNKIDGADKLITDANNRLVTDTDISNWNNKSDKGHKHTKSEITDFPTSLPANGGNADTVGGKKSSDFLSIDGKSSGSLQIGRTFYNVANFELSGTPIEIVIKTKIPFISGNAMPIIHLHGYAFGQQAPIELKIGYYVYSDKHGWCGAVSMGAWKPEIKLFSYMENNIKYTAIALIGSIYYPRFSVNLFDMWSNTTRDYSKGWTVEYTTSGTIIGTTDVCSVPYKSVYTASDIGASPSNHTHDERYYTESEVDNKLNSKVDKVSGKGLSTEDYTTAEKNKLSGIEAGANKYTHPSSHPASMITESTSRRFVSDTEKSTWNNNKITVGKTPPNSGWWFEEID